MSKEAGLNRLGQAYIGFRSNIPGEDFKVQR